MDKSQEKILMAWLKRQKGACGRYLSLAVIFGFLSGVALIIQAWLIATILQGVIIEQLARDHFLMHFTILVGLIFVRAALSYAREITSFEAGSQLRSTIREAVQQKLVDLGPAFIQGKPAGAWASIVLEQVEDLHDYYSRYLPQVTLAGMIPLVILVVVFPINWAGGLVLLLTAPLIPLFMVLVGMGAADANRKNFAALARLSGHFMDRLKGLNQIQLFSQGEAELKAITRASDEFRERTMTVLRMAFLSSAVLEFFAAVSIAVLAVYFGFTYLGHLDFGHYGESVSLFTGLFILILAPEFYQPLRDMGTHYHAKAQAVGAAEELMSLLNYQPSVEHSSNAPVLAKPLAQTNTAVSTGANVPPKISNHIGKIDKKIIAIEATDLTVMSFDGQPLVGPLSFKLQSTQKVGLVGPSGAGKTSLMSALLGFLPYEGSLAIVDESGLRQSLSQCDLQVWRSQIAWLGQNPQLFHGTLRDNLQLAGQEYPDKHLKSVLEKAQIGDFIDSLEQGLDYEIQDQAGGLSVGQAQRIALARAMMQDAQWYLLDEPSASLDSVSEVAVMSAISEATIDKSCLMITHRLDQLAAMDEIWVLANGKLVQQGHFEQLSAKEGLFKSMLSGHEQGLAIDLGTTELELQEGKQ